MCQQDYARIAKALEPVPERDLVLVVLTLDQSERKARGETEADAYRWLVDGWRSLARALRRAYGDVAHVATVEAHRNGWPHLNVLLRSAGFGRLVRRAQPKAQRWLREHAVSCGFGWSCVVRPVHDKQGAASYAAKFEGIGKPRGGIGAEVVKLCQLPINAPPGTRRLRSSKGFLPPRVHLGEWTGKLVRTPLPEVMVEQQRLGYRALLEHLRLNRAASQALDGRRLRVAW